MKGWIQAFENAKLLLEFSRANKFHILGTESSISVGEFIYMYVQLNGDRIKFNFFDEGAWWTMTVQHVNNNSYKMTYEPITNSVEPVHVDGSRGTVSL